MVNHTVGEATCWGHAEVVQSRPSDVGMNLKYREQALDFVQKLCSEARLCVFIERGRVGEFLVSSG